MYHELIESHFEMDCVKTTQQTAKHRVHPEFSKNAIYLLSIEQRVHIADLTVELQTQSKGSHETHHLNRRLVHPTAHVDVTYACHTGTTKVTDKYEVSPAKSARWLTNFL